MKCTSLNIKCCFARVDEDAVNSYFNELQNTFEMLGNYHYLFSFVWWFKITLYQKEKIESCTATPEINDIFLMLWKHWNCFTFWLGRIVKKFLNFPGYFTESNLSVFCLGDIPATDIFNHDKTNLQDDSGHSWVWPSG